MSSYTRLKRVWRRMVADESLTHRRFINAIDKNEKRRQTKDRWVRWEYDGHRFRKVNWAGRGLIHKGRKP